jgi:hemoglobin-like flavoprotein
MCDKPVRIARNVRTTVTSPDTAPTEKDISLVIKTFDKVVPIAGLAADLFYARLFEIAPALRAMFPDDMRDQKRKLFLMIASAVQGLYDLEGLVPQVKALGARHAGYGVKPEHYAIVGQALIWTLARGLGDAFTPQVEWAWTRVYSLLATTMQQGAAEVVALRAAE